MNYIKRYFYRQPSHILWTLWKFKPNYYNRNKTELRLSGSNGRMVHFKVIMFIKRFICTCQKEYITNDNVERQCCRRHILWSAFVEAGIAKRHTWQGQCRWNGIIADLFSNERASSWVIKNGNNRIWYSVTWFQMCIVRMIRINNSLND